MSVPTKFSHEIELDLFPFKQYKRGSETLDILDGIVQLDSSPAS